MDPDAAARRWRETWLRAWPVRDTEAVAALYADGATYRSHPFRDPEEGGVRGYLTRVFAEERPGTTCWFAEPIVRGDRAAIQYWAILTDPSGAVSTLAGVSVLRLGVDGLVVDHIDHWVTREGGHRPPQGWGGGSGPS
jgi:SnoaL-like domain